MAKKSSSTLGAADPIKGVLKLDPNDCELIIEAADGSLYSLRDIAKLDNGSADAKLTVAVRLSTRALGKSQARAELLSTLGELAKFLDERALGTLDSSATCCVVPKKPKKAPKPAKPGRPGKP